MASNIEEVLNKSKKVIKKSEFTQTDQLAAHINSKVKNIPSQNMNELESGSFILNHLLRSKTNKTNLFLSLYGLNKSEGCEVVTGTIDASQTTVSRIVLKESNTENHTGSSLGHRNYDDNRLEAFLQKLVILGKCSEEVVKKEKVFQLIVHLLNAMTDGESALLVIDDTQNILLPLMEQTRILSRMEAEKKKLLQVIILEQKKRIQALHSPQFKQTYQRISFRQKPDKFKVEEIRKNIENRLTMYGSKEEICFSTEALTFIRNNTFGISCMANLMLENAHLGLRNRKAIEVKEGIVEKTVEDLKIPKKEEGIEGEKKSSVKVKSEENSLFKPKRFKRIYLIGFGILAIIIAGVVIYISGRTWQNLTMFNLP